MELIESEKPAGCIFCEFPAQTGPAADKKNLVLGRSLSSFVIFNKYPYSNGHLMVVPRRHTAAFAELSVEESKDLHGLLQQAVRILEEEFHPDGMNIGMNLGRAAGAGITDHLHYHVVPRWSGDTNFMPVLTDTKVVIEHLAATYDKLRPKFDRALA